MKVTNMIGLSGAPVANQFIVEGEHYGQDGVFFQSYDTVIAFKPFSASSITLDKYYWDFSTTTSKYRNKFLNETKKETQAKINSGEYILGDLN